MVEIQQSCILEYPILQCNAELAHADQLRIITNSNKPQLPIYENNKL